SAQCFDGPAPASGFCIRMAAMPHVAIAHEGSCASTSRKAFSVSPYRNECSMATDRWKDSCTAGLQEFWKSTLPTWAWPNMTLGVTSTPVKSSDSMSLRVFIGYPLVAWPSIDDEELRADRRVGAVRLRAIRHLVARAWLQR